MNGTTVLGCSGVSRIKMFFALSRTPHGLLDMATPALGALLCLGRTPPVAISVLGFITAFAGYTAVYALNDVVDYRVDREKIERCGLPETCGDLDSFFVRHPLAQGLLGMKEAVVWTALWGLVAITGAYMLNPACVLVFLFGCLAEAAYCLMLKVSYIRTAVSGAVKTAGGIAAIFAVNPHPSPSFVVLFFLWLFFWEIGGQNVPNDLTDMQEDGDLQAETIPVRFGPRISSKVIAIALGLAILLSFCLFLVIPESINPIFLVGVLLADIFLLVTPARRLYRSGTSHDASALFNRASYYPLTMLVVALISSIV